MAVKTCPRCGASFIPTVSRCADCNVVLEYLDEDGAPAPDRAEDVAELVDAVGYELDDWNEDTRAELTAVLRAERIAHRWDGDELVVEERHAEVVEELIDDLDHPDALDAEDDDGDDRGARLLSALYVAADVLAGDPDHAGAVAEVLEAAEGIDEVAAPYGVDRTTWESVVERVEELADLLGDGAPDDELAGVARTLRDLVRPLV